MVILFMTAFRSQANIDANSHKGLIALNSIAGGGLILTGLSLTNAQPLHVAIVDGSGSQITSFGGGTQYTDGAVPPAHPVGNTIEWSDGSFWQTVSTAKPLPVSATFTPSGTQDVNVKTFGGSTVTIGQQTAANSMPVILPSATITTLTPPSNTGYALDSSLSTIDTDLKSNITLHAGTNAIGGITGAGSNIQIKDDTFFGDGVTTGILSTTGRVWNGSSYDRAYGDATSGAWVNIKAGTVGTTTAAVNVGQQTVSTSAVQVSSSSTIPTNGIIIKALSTNSAPIFVGGSGVTTSNGYELVAGESISFTCNLNTLYIRSAASTTDKISWNVE